MISQQIETSQTEIDILKECFSFCRRFQFFSSKKKTPFLPSKMISTRVIVTDSHFQVTWWICEQNKTVGQKLQKIEGASVIYRVFTSKNFTLVCHNTCNQKLSLSFTEIKKLFSKFHEVQLWCLQGLQRETIQMKWVNNYSSEHRSLFLMLVIMVFQHLQVDSSAFSTAYKKFHFFRYNEVLKNGLPDWRQPIYYYRKYRKMGNLEVSIIVSVILTIGHFLTWWVAYLEKKFEMVSHQKIKLQKSAMGKNKTKRASSLTELKFLQFSFLFELLILEGNSNIFFSSQ